MESTVLVKAFGLIEAMADHRSGLADLASAAGITKPSAHRILRSLVSLGYVESLGDGRYGLTAKLRQLSFGFDERTLVTLVEPTLRALRETTGETVNLGVLRNGRVVYLSVLESAHPLRRVGSMTVDDPVFTTALGRAIASQAKPDELERLLRAAAVQEKRTPKTITGVEQIKRIIDEARRVGHAIERDQNDIGVTCLAMPVFDGASVVAAISISAPSARAVGSEEKWLKALRRAVNDAKAMLADRRRASA